MRVLLFVLALAISAHAMPRQDLVVPKETSPEINAYIDEVINEIKLLIIEQNLEPMSLPNVVRDFEYVGLFGVHYTGNMSMTNGWLHGLVTMYRDGDVNMTYSTFYLHVSGRITFERMLMQYDFVTTLMDIGPEGTAECKILGTSMDFAYDMHLLTLQSNITEFIITSNGNIHCELRGIGFFAATVYEAVINIIINVWEDTILAILSSVIQDLMQQALDNLGGFTTAAPPQMVTMPALVPFMP